MRTSVDPRRRGVSKRGAHRKRAAGRASVAGPTARRTAARSHLPLARAGAPRWAGRCRSEVVVTTCSQLWPNAVATGRPPLHVMVTTCFRFRRRPGTFGAAGLRRRYRGAGITASPLDGLAFLRTTKLRLNRFPMKVPAIFVECRRSETSPRTSSEYPQRQAPRANRAPHRLPTAKVYASSSLPSPRHERSGPGDGSGDAVAAMAGRQEHPQPPSRQQTRTLTGISPSPGPTKSCDRTA
jgi:hypothetical protein